MKTSLLRFLRQPSTWRGITWVLTLFGIALSPEQVEAVGLAGIAVVAAIEVFSDEDKRKLPPIELQGHSEDDGYISRDALRSRLYIPPNHIAGTQYDERQTRFQRYDDPDDHHPDSAVLGMRDAVPAEAPSQVDMDKHETGFNS